MSIKSQDTPTFPEEHLHFDNYKGVTLHLHELPAMDDFATVLHNSLQSWKATGIRGVWMHVAPSYAVHVPTLAAAGFAFHSCHQTVLIMTHWLDDTKPNRLPAGPSHQVGVGCVVLNPADASQMLVVQELSGPAAAAQLWKMPTGLVDAGEDVHQAALRELYEETGLRAVFRGLLCQRQAHASRRGRTASDLFCVCVLQVEQPVEWTACPEEIAAIQWMSVQEYCDQERWQTSPVYMELNGLILELSEQKQKEEQQDVGGVWEAHTLPLGFYANNTATNTLYAPKR